MDTGTWLSGRKVLLPPSVLGHIDPVARSFSVRLSRSQVEASPGDVAHLPVSRQYETELYDHYHWSPYWGTGYFMAGYGGIAAPMMIAHPEPDLRDPTRDNIPPATSELHLRSASEVTGYYIHATDGDIGHLADILVEDTDWTIRYLVIDTSNWWMGKTILISPRSATDIRWSERLVYLDVTRDKIKSSPTYDPNQRVDRAMEDQIAAHYAEREFISPL